MTVVIWDEGGIDIIYKPLPSSPCTLKYKIILTNEPPYRNKPDIKSTNWIELRKPHETLKSNLKADEVIMSKDGIILEGLISNIIFKTQSKLITPSRDILKGYVRSKLISKYNVIERDVQVEEIKGCEGIWVCNSIKGVVSVEEVLDEGGRVVWRGEGGELSL